MIYIESSFNKSVVRLLSEEEIKIQLINKIPKGKKIKQFVFNSIEDIKNLFSYNEYSIFYNLINITKKKKYYFL